MHPSKIVKIFVEFEQRIKMNLPETISSCIKTDSSEEGVKLS